MQQQQPEHLKTAALVAERAQCAHKDHRQVPRVPVPICGIEICRHPERLGGNLQGTFSFALRELRQLPWSNAELPGGPSSCDLLGSF